MSKYWNYGKSKEQALKIAWSKIPGAPEGWEPVRVSSPRHNYVTLRDKGDIPDCTYLPPNDRYRGVFPSEEAVAFINGMKAKMKYFDDGERLVYNGKTYFKHVIPGDVVHPISYPPAGFELVDGQWVYKGD